jgi:hypothetical protein
MEESLTLFFFDEDVITSNSYLYVLENYALVVLRSSNNNSLLKWTVHLFILLTLFMTV